MSGRAARCAWLFCHAPLLWTNFISINFAILKMSLSKCRKVDKSLKIKVGPIYTEGNGLFMIYRLLSILELLFIWENVPCNCKVHLHLLDLDIKTSKNNFWSWYSGSQSHTTRRGRASCSLWYAPVANVCDSLLFLDENRGIPDFRHFWKVISPDEKLFTVLYFPFDAFSMTWPRKLFTGLNSTGMMVTWLRTLANTRP